MDGFSLKVGSSNSTSPNNRQTAMPQQDNEAKHQLSVQLTALYGAYDETALKTYANAGLLRRAKKDVKSGNVSITQHNEQSIALVSDGQQVSLPNAGLTDAGCDCPAVGACKHIVAAVLYVQSLDVADSESTDDVASNAMNASNPNNSEQAIDHTGTQSNDTNNVDAANNHSQNFSQNNLQNISQSAALAEILALSLTDLQNIAKKMPKAKRLKMFSMVFNYFESFNDLNAPNLDSNPDASNLAASSSTNKGQLVIQPSSVCIQLVNQPQEIRYIIGAGFAGMLSNIERDKNSYHFLALLLVKQQHGEPELFLSIYQWLQQQLNITNASNNSNSIQLTPANLSMLADLTFDIHQLLQQGLSQIDSYLANRMHLANTLARSQHLPRLATHLRQLSGLMHDFVSADNHVNESKLLQALAELWVYLYQLKHSKGAVFQQLRGKLRQSYDSNAKQPSLNLYPLGARWWQSQGKARGLTLYFYEKPQADGLQGQRLQGQCIEFTQARGQAQDPSFDKQSAWYNSVWLTTAQHLMSQHSVLENPRFSDEVGYSVPSNADKHETSEDSSQIGSAFNSKLAVTGSKVTQTTPIGNNFTAYIDSITPFAHSHWASLVVQWRQQLANEGRVNPLVVLNPAHIGGMLIDEVEQCVWWQLADSDDAQLKLRLDWRGNQQTSINKIKLLERIDINQVRMVVAYVQVHEHAISLEPMTLVLQDRLFHLDYDQVPPKKTSLKDLLSGRVSMLMSKKKRLLAMDANVPTNLTQLVCEPILQILTSLSATGRLYPTQQQQDVLKQQLALAKDAGLGILAGQLQQFIAQQEQDSQEDANPTTYIDKLLNLVYLCQVLRLLEVDMPVTMAAAVA